jgi:hypothetical protein
MSLRMLAGQSQRIVYWAAGAASLMLSVWLALHLDIINPDAICYVLSAKQAGESGMTAAMHLCGQASWPFYSVLIYAFSKARCDAPRDVARCFCHIDRAPV